MALVSNVRTFDAVVLDPFHGSGATAVAGETVRVGETTQGFAPGSRSSKRAWRKKSVRDMNASRFLG